MKNNKVIIIGPAMVNTLGMIRSCGEEKLSVHLMLQGKKSINNYVRFSRYISKIYYFSSDSELLEIFHRYYWNEKEKIAVLCGGDDAISFLDNHYDELVERFHFFNCGKQGTINFYLDKTKQFAIAEQAGLSIIKTWVITDVHHLPKDITFPCLTKGRNSIKSNKSDMHICQTRKELKDCLRENTEYIVQEYLEKEYELNCICLAYNHGKEIIAPCAIRKVRDDIGRQSAYFHTDDFTNYPNFNRDILARIANILHYEGIFSVELIYSKGKYYFLEINLRNDGCGFLYTAAGCNYPYIWHQYTKGLLTANVGRNVQAQTYKYMMSEQDLRNLFDRKVGFATWLKQFLTCDAFYILSFTDPLPFFYSNFVHLKQFVKRILGLPLV